jgi:hypothetical protein
LSKYIKIGSFVEGVVDDLLGVAEVLHCLLLDPLLDQLEVVVPRQLPRLLPLHPPHEVREQTGVDAA